MILVRDTTVLRWWWPDCRIAQVFERRIRRSSPPAPPHEHPDPLPDTLFAINFDDGSRYARIGERRRANADDALGGFRVPASRGC
jgi:hypothetical protein